MQDFIRIFQGVAIKPIRDYLLSELSRLVARYERFIVPCAGGLNPAELAIRAGWKGDQIHTSDISLFTSAVGYALSNQPIENLQVQFNSSALTQLSLRSQSAADILFAIKLSTLPQKNYYQKSIVAHYLETKTDQLANLKATIDEMRTRVVGIHYEIADMWKIIEQYKNDASALFWINPPGYKNGYSKMYDTKGALTWAEPQVPEFDPSTQHEHLFRTALGAKALFILYPHVDIPNEHRENIIFGFNERKGKPHRLFSNRPAEHTKSISLIPRTPVRAARYPLLPPDYEITENSKITWVKTTREVCLYYRDLFAHKLGSTNAEMYFLVLIDGYIISAFGLCAQKVALGHTENLNEVFCFSHPHNKYFRLNKLSMMTITCRQCLEEVKKFWSLEGRVISGLSTTCLGPHPELKPNRGILKLISRRQIKPGSWHLVYQTKWHDRNFQDCLKLWLAKEVRTGTGLRE